MSIPVVFSVLISILVVKLCCVTFKIPMNRADVELDVVNSDSRRLVSESQRQRPPSLGDLPPSYNETIDIPPWTRTGVSQDMQVFPMETVRCVEEF